MTAIVLDGKATASAIKADLKARVDVLRSRGVVPGLGTVLVGDDPSSHSYVAGQASRLRRGRHRQHPTRAARRRRPKPTSKTSFVSSTPTRPAPATSCSCRCREALTSSRCSSWSIRARTPTGCIRAALAGWCLMQPGPQPCTPRGCVELLAHLRRADQRRRSRRGRARRHRRSPDRPAAHPPHRERDRHPVPHRHERPRRRTCVGPTSSSPPPGCPG